MLNCISKFQQLAQLLDNIKLEEEKDVPYNYQSVKIKIVHDELRNEIFHLRQMLEEYRDKNDEDGFRIAFRTRCAERARNNAETCLSFSSLLEGECNQLYWEIIKLFFAPQTMGELFEILLDVKYEWQYADNVIVPLPKEDLRYPPLKWIEKPISMLNEPANLENLRHYILSGSYVFDLSQLQNLTFPWLLHLYKFFQTKPDLANKIWQHNEALKQLYEDLNFLSNESPPYDYFVQLIKEMRLGGERLTGQKEASKASQNVVKKFFFDDYWVSLSETTQKEIASLSNKHGKTMAMVFSDLEQGECIETCASDMNSILANPESQAVLQKIPKATLEKIKTIKDRYRKQFSLSVEGYDPTYKLPRHALKDQLSNIIISNKQGFLTLLMFFPTDLYSDLFNETTFQDLDLPKILEEATEVLNQEQLFALNRTIVENKEKMGGLISVLNIAYLSSNTDLIQKVMPMLTSEMPKSVLQLEQLQYSFRNMIENNLVEKNQLLVFNQTIIENKENLGGDVSLFVFAVFTNNTDLIHKMMTLLINDTLLVHMKEEPFRYWLCRAIQDNLIEEKHLLALQQLLIQNREKLDAFSLLEFAANTESCDLVQSFLPLLTIDVLLDQKNRLWNTLNNLIKKSLINEKQMQALSQLLFENLDQLGGLIPVLTFALDNCILDLGQRLLPLVTKETLIEMQKKAPNVLPKNPFLLKQIFASLTEIDSLEVVRTTGMIRTIMNPEAFGIVLSIYPKEERLSLLKHKLSARELPIIEKIKFNRLQYLPVILELLSEEDCFTLARDSMNNKPFLTYLSENPLYKHYLKNFLIALNCSKIISIYKTVSSDFFESPRSWLNNKERKLIDKMDDLLNNNNSNVDFSTEDIELILQNRFGGEQKNNSEESGCDLNCG